MFFLFSQMAGLAGYPGLGGPGGLLPPGGLTGPPALGSGLHGAFQPKVRKNILFRMVQKNRWVHGVVRCKLEL